jgi:hypothetical protein
MNEVRNSEADTNWLVSRDNPFTGWIKGKAGGRGGVLLSTLQEMATGKREFHESTKENRTKDMTDALNEAGVTGVRSNLVNTLFELAQPGVDQGRRALS